MKEELTIPKEINKKFGLDFSELKKKGLEYIEQLASKLWTDYNNHDPGITSLDLLCYAISDLGYRISMPMEDILAVEKDNKTKMQEHFQTALEIMPCAPITENDYRKLFIRTDGIKNAWLQISDHYIIANYKKQPPELRYTLTDESAKVNEEIKFKLKGIHDILIEFDEIEGETQLEKEFKKLEIIRNVKKIYHHFRNLCEDVDEVKEVPQQLVSICANIELDPKADPEKVWAEIIFAIQNYLSPEVYFYTLQEMFEKGKTSDEIFEGPVFKFDTLPVTDNPADNAGLFTKKGFIDSDEIINSALKEEVRLSDIINLIMKINGVKVIKSIFLDYCQSCTSFSDDYQPTYNTENWHICIKKGYKPVLSINKTVLNFYKDVIPIELKEQEALDNLDVLKDERKLSDELAQIEDIPIPKGKYRNIKNYETIQNHYPETYGIGEVGLSENVSVKRKALAKQFKAYLLFFDQVLANYFSQLSNVRILLSDEYEIKKTYFNNAVQQVKDDSVIYQKTDNWEESIDTIYSDSKLDNYVERKNKFLDHLLARFAEQFNEYVFLLYGIYQDNYNYSIIRHKSEFIKDYHTISAYRADALDYFNKKTTEEQSINLSGLEKRLSRFLGFNYKKQKIAELPYEIKKVDISDPNSNYTWIMKIGVTEILKGTGNSTSEVYAYEEMGMSTVLGSDREFYKVGISYTDPAKVVFTIINSENTIIAYSSNEYDILSGEQVTGIYSKAETAISEIIDYFRNEFKMEGISIVEHILLRPDFDKASIPPDEFMPVCIDANGEHCNPLDPYSFRIAVILPGYTMRLRNINFRKYVEKLIRLETPAHILPRICFVGQGQMKEFEDLYELWLNSRINSSNPEKQVDPQLNKDFIDLIEKLFTIYPEGELADCDDDTKETNPIILDQTFLGTLENE